MFLYCFYLKQIFEYQKSVNITVFIISSVLFFYYLIIYNVFYIPYQTSLEKHIPGFFFFRHFGIKNAIRVIHTLNSIFTGSFSPMVL